MRRKIQNPSIWKTLKFGHKSILVQIGFTGLCVSVKNPDPSFGVFFSPDHLILNLFRLKVKVKIDLLKLTLTLIFPPNYFQILRPTNSKPFYLENIEVRTRDDYIE
jgi:hypothetical protein